MLTLTFLGTSSGVPTRERNVSGLAVQTALGPDWLLVDCGEGTQHRLQRVGLSLHHLAAICITHVHGDHCYGLPGLLDTAGMHGRTRPLKLIAPQPVRDWLRATARLTDAELPYALDFVDVAGEEACVYRAPGVQVERHALCHRVPSHAFRIEVQTQDVRLKTDALRAIGLPPGPTWGALQRGEDVPFGDGLLRSADFADVQTHRASAVLGGDNAEPALLRTACEGAQLLVHEATFTQPMLDKVGPAPMHSSARAVAAFAQSAGVPNLVLTHLSARHQNAEGEAALLAEARAEYRGALWLARDLDRFTLGADGRLQHQSAAKATDLL